MGTPRRREQWVTNLWCASCGIAITINLQFSCLNKTGCEIKNDIAVPTDSHPFLCSLKNWVSKTSRAPTQQFTFPIIPEGTTRRTCTTCQPQAAASSHVNARPFPSVTSFAIAFLSERTWHVSLTVSCDTVVRVADAFNARKTIA